MKEEITALAREYAEEMIKGRPSEELPNCLKNSMLTMNTEYVAEIFQWLTRRFYIVEKERVKDEYEKAKMDMVSKYHQGSMVVLQVLFPEIGKEVER